MRRVANLMLPGIALAMLVACSPPPAKDVDKQEARAKGRDTDETVFDDMIQTQDRARAVEDLTLGRKADLDSALEQQTGGGDPDAH
jgi:hypothetical protein